MDTPISGPKRDQPGYLEAVLLSHANATSFPVPLGVMKTRPVECSIECGRIHSSLALP
jgi:hypothetical protein